MDVKSLAVNGLKVAFTLFEKDLEALPEEAMTKKFGDATRTVADIVHEVNLVNDHIGMTIRGEEPFDWPDGGWIVAPEGLDSKEAVLAAFRASSEKILQTVEAFSQEDFLGKVQTERGETDRFERCRFMAMHLHYHSGQLNYIQTLFGDTEWHWN